MVQDNTYCMDCCINSTGHELLFDERCNQSVSNSDLKRIYRYIEDSKDGVSMTELKSKLNINQISDKVNHLEDSFLIRRKWDEINSQFVYVKDVILPCQEISKYLK